MEKHGSSSSSRCVSGSHLIIESTRMTSTAVTVTTIKKHFVACAKVMPLRQRNIYSPAQPSEKNKTYYINEVLKKWSIPYSALGHLPGFSIKRQWIQILQKKLSKNQKSLTLSAEKMQQLVEDYWSANKNNRHKKFPHFWRCVVQALRRYKCSCSHRHSCELRNCWATPPSLIALMQKHFCLEVEGMADALHHSDHLKEWYSLYQEDQAFGAKRDFFKQELKGKNIYINPPFNTFEGNRTS